MILYLEAKLNARKSQKAKTKKQKQKRKQTKKKPVKQNKTVSFATFFHTNTMCFVNKKIQIQEKHTFTKSPVLCAKHLFQLTLNQARTFDFNRTVSTYFTSSTVHYLDPRNNSEVSRSRNDTNYLLTS